MKTHLISTDKEGFKIDPSTGFVINTSDAQLLEYKKERERRKKLKTFEQRLEELEKSQEDIKNLLTKILDKVS